MRVPAKTMAIMLLLVATAVAQQDALEMGCEVYTDYWLCPQAKPVFNAPLEYTTDVECDYLFGESLGCFGQAKLLSDVHFKECWVYIPLLPSNEVDFDNYQYDYDCRDKSWGTGTIVNLSTAPYLVSNCVTKEGGEGYETQICATAGQRVTANATVEEEGGVNYMIVMSSVPYAGVHVEWWHWIAIIIVVIAIIWAIGKLKK